MTHQLEIRLVVLDWVGAVLDPGGRPVPGLGDAVVWLRGKGIKVGAVADASRTEAEAWAAAAKAEGFEPDAAACADDVPGGRPAPWLLFRVMERVGVYPPTLVVSVVGAAADVAAGLNAGAWAVGIVDCGREMGLTEAELAALSESDREVRREEVRNRFLDAGADAVIDTYADLPDLIAALNQQVGG